MWVKEPFWKLHEQIAFRVLVNARQEEQHQHDKRTHWFSTDGVRKRDAKHFSLCTLHCALFTVWHQETSTDNWREFSLQMVNTEMMMSKWQYKATANEMPSRFTVTLVKIQFERKWNEIWKLNFNLWIFACCRLRMHRLTPSASAQMDNLIIVSVLSSVENNLKLPFYFLRRWLPCMR